ncbi:MAG: DUF933 domain-containing protein, partial [Elusimicrobiota bacterium]|nr:DUF933 domain-containing protein [Elusimicrobiota bacterium]
AQELEFESKVGQLIEKAYKMLNLVTFYTVVGKEVRAWSVPNGTNVKKASGKIHSDMEKGFIRAEVYRFDELIKYHSEDALRNKGLIRTEGKDYIVQDGDILCIKFSS